MHHNTIPFFLTALLLSALSLATGCDRGAEPEEPAAPEQTDEELPTFAEWQPSRAQTFDAFSDLAALLPRAETARFVVLGASSPGVAEFIELRAELTLALLGSENAPDLIALELDFHTVQALNDFLRGDGDPDELSTLLTSTFTAWPPWPWKSAEFAAFLLELRSYYVDHPDRFVPLVGLGSDSPHQSVDGLLTLVERHHPEIVAPLREHLVCLERFRSNPVSYLRAVHDSGHGHRHQHGHDHDHDHDHDHHDEGLCDEATEAAHALVATTFTGSTYEDLLARGHSRAILNFERNSRSQFLEFPAEVSQRNLGYLEALQEFFDVLDEEGRALVWVHNVHVGDTRGTVHASRGDESLGTLLRTNYAGEDSLLLGLAARQGHLLAAADTRRPTQHLDLPPGIEGSLEHLMVHPDGADALYVFDDADQELPAFASQPGHRRIFNVYDPPREHFTAYVETNPAQTYDALIFLHETRALNLLEDE